jgi:hypothetical protein
VDGRFGGRIAAALCGALFAGGYLIGGVPAVVGLAVVAVAVVAGYVYSPSWKVEDRLGGRGGRWPRGRARMPSGAPGGSGVRIRHQRDAHVVHHEGGQGEGVEHLMEAEPPR